MDSHTTIQMAQDIGEIKGMLEGLAGPTGRITKLEEASTRQWWYTVGLVPLFGLLRLIAKKMGL